MRNVVSGIQSIKKEYEILREDSGGPHTNRPSHSNHHSMQVIRRTLKRLAIIKSKSEHCLPRQLSRSEGYVILPNQLAFPTPPWLLVT